MVEQEGSMRKNIPFFVMLVTGIAGLLYAVCAKGAAMLPEILLSTSLIVLSGALICKNSLENKAGKKTLAVINIFFYLSAALMLATVWYGFFQQVK